VLSLNNLQVNYTRTRAVQGLSLTLEPGETLALVGANGAGKSSTLKAIMGLVKPSSGEIALAGTSITAKKPPEIVRLGIGYSPEGRRVFPLLSVEENLQIGGYTIRKEVLKTRIERMYGYFPRLRERSAQQASSLSGGEQQMLAIARALVPGPRVLLLDEPSLGLAPVIVKHIGRLIQEVQEREGVSVILAEQNANWALRVAQNAVILELGRAVLAGPSATCLRDPGVQRAYLGR
jgi:branched-chain amino acid transport system ATP-binding protein